MFPEKKMGPSERIQIIDEACRFMFSHVDDMKLQQKDVLVVIGQSRTGKGTLLSALQGNSIKLFKRKKNQGGVH